MATSPHPPPAALAPVRSLPAQERGTRPRAVPILAGGLGLWHLLSLDAPTVTTLWVIFIARCAGVALPWTDAAAMFTAVWILYAADRLLDARGLRADPKAPGLEARHRFHHRHRVAFRIALAGACALLTWLLRRANPAALRLDIVLGGLLLVWLLLVHLRSVLWSHPPRLPKELAVGVFFAAAVFIPSVARVPALRPALLPDALLLAAACSLNCLFIFRWEHPYHRTSPAHASTRWAVERLPALAGAVCAASLVAALVLLHASPAHLALPALACAISAALLLTLHRCRGRLSSLSLRAAADLCLLTPFLLLAR